jgi:hypothetical protein
VLLCACAYEVLLATDDELQGAPLTMHMHVGRCDCSASILCMFVCEHCCDHNVKPLVSCEWMACH